MIFLLRKKFLRYKIWNHVLTAITTTASKPKMTTLVLIF